MKLKFIFIFIASFYVNLIMAKDSIEDSFSIRTGFSTSKTLLTTNLISSNHHEEKDNDISGVGFTTNTGYRFSYYEFGATSDVIFGNLHNQTFKIENNNVTGDGHYRYFSVTPYYKHYSNYILLNRWNYYFSLGPTWSLHTFVLTNISSGNSNISNKRISFENRGLSLNFGVEEIVPYKSAHPTFIEFSYSYQKSYQIFVVDASDFTDVKTLSKGISHDYKAHYLSLRLGITLF